MHTHDRGLLVAIEGIDGCGKTTLARHLADCFEREYKKDVVVTRQPAGTALGKDIWRLVKDTFGAVHARAEFLLYAADRAQHMAELVLPALAQGKVVIGDRTGDSSVAYQGYGRGLDCDMIKTVNAWACQGRKPDVTLYIRLSPEVAAQRIVLRNKKLNSFEKENFEFFERVIKGFDSLYKDNDRAFVLDGMLSEKELAAKAWQLIQGLLF